MQFDTRVGAYAVVVRDDHVLLAHWVLDQAQRTLVGGLEEGWTLPGGGLEAGEDPEAAAVREFLEETGYVIELTRLLGTNSLHFGPADRSPGQPPRAFHALRLIYEGRIIAGDLTPEVGGSTDEARWFPLADVERIDRVSLVDAGVHLWRRAQRTLEAAQ